MNRIWRHKWIVLAVAMVIFLSIGAAAWAASNDDPASGAASLATGNADDGLAGLVASLGDGSGNTAERAAAGMRAMKHRGEQWLKRQAALMDKLREDMTPADQALYDQLVSTSKDQREALKQARENLADTLKKLRDLRNKYLDAATGATN